MNIKLERTGRTIAHDDLFDLEGIIGFDLPEQFRNFYLKNNGGVPNPNHFPAHKEFDPICISSFLCVKYPCGTENNMEDTYQKGVRKNYLPSDLLPFAVDWGGNYICINKMSEIFFYSVDRCCEDLDNHESINRNKRFICQSFEDFINSLVDEDEAYD
ncbi:SMI1/KNR4 family protein [Vibrio vulnificus]|uniref:SMI1/KNR4 family protein n=1 Tax=Vibrio vulnificus TaxID=672 RepID=UPI0005F0FE85|nr:SMI1/KNR4 family protein [Vibrio vulnificus]MCA3909846.1 SMI1/KNR4 family protein [Vibrio vulnificus]